MKMHHFGPSVISRVGFSLFILHSWILISQATPENPTGTEKFKHLLTQARQLKEKGGTGPIVITVPPGTYTLDRPIRITAEDSGSKDRPIIFKVKDITTTKFTSARPLPPLRETPEGTWTCELPDGFVLDQLFVNGHRTNPVRLPSQGYFTIQSVTQKITKMGGDKRSPAKATQTIRLDQAAAKQLSKIDLSQARMTVLHKWDSTHRSNVTFDAEQSSLISHGRGMKSWNSWKKGSRFFLENVEGVKLTPGEWRLTGRTFTYAPRPNESLKITPFVAPQLDKLLIIQGTQDQPVSYLRFEGFQWTGSSLNLPNGMPPNQAANVVDAAIMVDHATEIHFYANNIYHIGRYAIWFRENCHHCSIKQSLISDIGAGGVRIGDAHLRSKTPTSHITVDHTMIQGAGRLLPCAVGIWIGQSGDNRITYNTITDLYYTGISVGWTWGYGKSYTKNNKILFNHIHNIGQGMLSDMGAVYCLSVSPGTEVSGNHIHDIESHSYGGWGLYTDEGSTGIKMENNLVYRTKCGGFHQHYGKENIIRNNIFADATLYQIQATRPEKHLSFEFTHNIISFKKGTLYQGPFLKIQNKIDHNLIWCPETEKITSEKSKLFGGRSFQAWQQSGRGVHSVIGDPQFADPANGDYTPKNTELLKKIGFKLFDPKQAGVFGKKSKK